MEQELAPLAVGEVGEVQEEAGEVQEDILVQICSESGAVDPSSWKYFDSDFCSLDLTVVLLQSQMGQSLMETSQ